MLTQMIIFHLLTPGFKPFIESHTNLSKKRRYIEDLITLTAPHPHQPPLSVSPLTHISSHNIHPSSSSSSSTVWDEWSPLICNYQLLGYLTNRFHVAVRLFSNRSQMMSKCCKNKKVAHEAIAECVTDVLTTF